MKIKELLQEQYNNFLLTRSMQFNKPEDDNTTESDKRLIFLVDNVLDLTTYCDKYSIQIGTKLLDILKWLTRKNDQLKFKSKYDYRSNEEYEFVYCLMVQHIMTWINYGTNIYTAWLDKIILYDNTNNKYEEFTSNTAISYFINFIDNKN